MNCSKPLLTLLAGTLAALLATPVLSVEKPAAGSTAVVQGPIHDPDTNSYFELRVSTKEIPAEHWEEAYRAAPRFTHDGRRGRLAVVRDVRTLNFLRENFRFNQSAWVGLRFFCEFRKLVWVTGELQALKSPGMWAPQWHRTSIKCTNNNIQYMPVYLTGEKRGYVSFQASGPAKAFKSYLVEYPAPKQSDKKAQAPTD